MPAPKQAMKVPKTMNWEAFIGPARFRPITLPIHLGVSVAGGISVRVPSAIWLTTFSRYPSRLLNSGYPSAVIGSSTMLMSDACPPQLRKSSFRFPARDNLPRLALPLWNLLGTTAV